MTAALPNRSIFRAQEVCEIAQVQPYVLRSWEAEFPDLGVAKTASGPRVYRRTDVERVLRLKHLLFVDGLTLAGARRRLSEEGLAVTGETVSDADVAALVDDEMRQHLREVRRSLQWMLGVLGRGAAAEEFVLVPAPVERPAKRKPAKSKPAMSNPVKSNPVKSKPVKSRPVMSKPQPPARYAAGKGSAKKAAKGRKR